MSDLVSRVLSAIEQREQQALRARRDDGETWAFYLSGDTMSDAVLTHIAGNDPAAVLRLCQSLRDIVEMHEAVFVRQPGPKVLRCRSCGDDARWVAWPCKTLWSVARGLGIEDTMSDEDS